MSFWILWLGVPSQPGILLEPTSHIQDLRIPKAFLTICSLASLERAHELQTTHMSRGFDLGFVLFVLGMVTYQVSLGSLFLSLSGLGLSLAPWFRGREIVVLEDL